MTAQSRIVVVGLGPGATSHVTTETLTEIDRVPIRYVRTRVHPSAHLVADAMSFDDVYETAEKFDDVYDEITSRLISAAGAHGEILYAVPGSPLVLERSVAQLIASDVVDVTILPAMSFLDVAWARLGIDPVEAAVRLVDGHAFSTAAAGSSGALLVAHTHANWVLSDIKLSIDGIDDAPVTLLRGLGTTDEQIIETTWAEMDRTIEADHLTSLYIPSLPSSVARGYVRFHELVRTLREQCPWGVEQTHHSLVPYLIEETYEVVDAIADLGSGGPSEIDEADAALIEELGDLLYQIEFHATIAEQDGRFSIDDVTTGIHDKLVRRHPHVFADVAVDGTDAVLANWDAIKRAEKGRTSVFDGVPGALPSLAYANTVQQKAAKVGFDWPDVSGALPKIAEEADELTAAVESGAPESVIDELGDLLFSVVNVARHLGVDPESALRAATNKFRRRFEHVESLAAELSIDLHATDLPTLDALWNEVKARDAASDVESRR